MNNTCGTCEFVRYNKNYEDFYCKCEDSDYYLDFIEYNHTCECWEEKDD